MKVVYNGTGCAYQLNRTRQSRKTYLLLKGLLFREYSPAFHFINPNAPKSLTVVIAMHIQSYRPRSSHEFEDMQSATVNLTFHDSFIAKYDDTYNDQKRIIR